MDVPGRNLCGADSSSRNCLLVEIGERTDLIIMDAVLPDTDGISFMEIRKKSDIPILVLTSERKPESIIGGLESGADDYMTKPFESGRAHGQGKRPFVFLWPTDRSESDCFWLSNAFTLLASCPD